MGVKADRSQRIFYKNTARQWRFILPPDVQAVQSVRYVEKAYPDGLLLFEAPDQQSYLLMLAHNGHRPQTEGEAKEYLKHSFDLLHRPCWFVLNGSLLVYPTPVNDAYLVVDIATREGSDVQGE